MSGKRSSFFHTSGFFADMGRLGLDKVLDCFSLSLSSSSCLCMNSLEDEEEIVAVERDSLIVKGDQIMRVRDLLEPKTVILRVSMHCNGCARKVEKHIKKIEGVTSLKVDLENKRVVVVGDITPCEILESVSKVKFAQLLVAP
ncbi:protein SODIUM POTASSIUM ROOT DEFECTIVE 2-like [Iris pallida]|uniref:Protein SODIUM POTASSIUM ROOT DEFECTIVE 2-like n=1 Tax=Iris pallida TaxID=29817 RepID=A0AAX6HEL2_IRIPA|nr:protein SODIUM POTASSIUM ROOT DEFECTIVE 2-like [Iris pallida]